jgi:hypothetical protein
MSYIPDAFVGYLIAQVLVLALQEISEEMFQMAL